ncbi:hypothetical protein F5B19DRAFT_312937 [Rostrohypoxylon terebratum]|nr:hypothetical protein F5B19DRAFT_312937 [Rostrohypoxylon terebratum]
MWGFLFYLIEVSVRSVAYVRTAVYVRKYFNERMTIFFNCFNYPSRYVQCQFFVIVADVDGKSDFQAYYFLRQVFEKKERREPGVWRGLGKRKRGGNEGGLMGKLQVGWIDPDSLTAPTALTCFDWVYRFGGLRLQKQVLCSISTTSTVPVFRSVSDARVDQSGC